MKARGFAEIGASLERPLFSELRRSGGDPKATEGLHKDSPNAVAGTSTGGIIRRISRCSCE